MSSGPEHSTTRSLRSLHAEIHSLRLLRFMLFLLSFSTTATMAGGMLSMLRHPDFLQSAGCVVLSLACGASLFAIADKALALGPRLADPGAVAGAVALVVVQLLITLGASTWFVAVLLGGATTETAYRDAMLTRMDRALDLRAEQFRSAEREFAPRLFTESMKYRVASGLEASGLSTPRPGEGVVYGTKLQLAEAYREASEQTTASLRSAQEIWNGAKEAVRRTRATVFDPALDQNDADKAMQAAAATVSRQLAQMEQFDPLEVPQGFVHVTVTVPRRGVTDAERQEMERLSEKTEENSARLHEDAAAMRAARPDVPRVEYRPKSPGETVLTYASACPGALITPIACDALGVLAIGWSLLGAADERRRRKAALEAAFAAAPDRNGAAPLAQRHQMQFE